MVIRSFWVHIVGHVKLFSLLFGSYQREGQKHFIIQYILHCKYIWHSNSKSWSLDKVSICLCISSVTLFTIIFTNTSHILTVKSGHPVWCQLGIADYIHYWYFMTSNGLWFWMAARVAQLCWTIKYLSLTAFQCVYT